ncbi:MAG: family 10 glycosylhydrolase [Victivallales bacterium]|nr:family 10 glycosylhydrolase [Victivallales bacterium]
MKKILALLIILSFAASAQQVAIIKGTVRQDSPGAGEMESQTERIRSCIASLGVTTVVIPDNAITAQKLNGVKLAIFPYNAPLLDKDYLVIETFVKNGGQIMTFYSSDVRLAELLDLQKTEYIPPSKLGSPTGIKFNPSLLVGLPDTMTQGSWNINHPVPKPGSKVKVIGRWIDKDGKDLGYNAVTLSPHGAAFAHTYLNQSPSDGARFFLAVVGHVIPEVWEKAAKKTIDNAGVYGNAKSFNELYLRITTDGTEKARQTAFNARKLYDEALALQKEKKYNDAIQKAQQADNDIKSAYALSFPPRPNELRGVWIHSPYGIRDWGWDRTIKYLADNGFNTVFPNMLWGYVADYESDVLPRHPSVATRGDQIKLCLEACRKYGVEMHVWKVCWNMGSHTPSALVEEMQKAKRTQVTIHGKDSKFLAPHIQENLQMEIDAFLEIVRKYPVDGIHFDYIRYPDPSSAGDFSDSARDAFEKFLGKKVEDWPKSCQPGGKLRSKFNEWRRGNINRLVEAVHKQAKAIRPDIKISAAVYTNWESSPESIAQSAITWIKNGWLDFVCPMDYTKEDTAFIERLVKSQTAATAARMPLYAGIGTYEHSNPAKTAEQIDAVRRFGADGFICFQHDSRFATRFLPLLKESVTREPAGELLPHHSVYARYSFAASKQFKTKDIFPIGEQIHITAQFPPKTNLPKNLRPRLLKDGYLLAEQPKIQYKRVRKSIICKFTPELPGKYRLEITDEKGILTRCQTFTVLSEEETKLRKLMAEPPQFTNNGKLRVAVWQDHAYGAEPILKFLQNSGLYDVAPLYNLEPKSLKPCQVIILPQPRQNSSLFKSDENAKHFQKFMDQGGAVITTHALVGMRGYFNLAPTIVGDVTKDPVQGNIWKAKGNHVLARAIPQGPSETTFVDFTTMKAAKNGTVVAVDEKDNPVIIVGNVGRGRYVACGLGIGITKGDKDTDLNATDNDLLTKLIEWAGKIKK